MAEEIKQEKIEEKKIVETSKSKDFDSSQKLKISDTNIEKAEEKPVEIKKEEKGKKEKKQEIPKKDEAVVCVKDLPISTKHSIAVCNLIRGKKIETAIKQLEEVTKFKRAVIMKGEIPHRKGGIIGRYPINATKIFIKLLKSLNANSSVNGLENPYISLAKANLASRPHKRFGRQRFKRTNVLLEAREKPENKKENKEKK